MEMCEHIDKVGPEDIIQVSKQIFGHQYNGLASLVVQGPVGYDCLEGKAKKFGIESVAV